MLARVLLLIGIVSVMLLVFSGTAEAHPADMYLQTYTLTLSPAGADLTWSLYPGPLLAVSVWDQTDTNEDGRISTSEAEAWIQPKLGDIGASLDNTTPLSWQFQRVEWPSSEQAFQLGDEKINVYLSVEWPLLMGTTHQLNMINVFEEAASLSWFYIEGHDGVTFEKPTQNNNELSVEFLLPGAENAALTYWDSGQPSISTSDSPTTIVVEQSEPEDNRASSKLSKLVRTENLTPAFTITALAIALGLGALHALTPGHGKALVAAYLIGTRGTPRHALVLGGIVTLTHTGSVLLLGGITLLASEFIVPTDLFPFLEVASGVLIIVLGISLVRWRWRGFRAVMRKRAAEREPTPEPTEKRQRIAINEPVKIKVYDEVLPQDVGGVRWKSLVTLGISGGLVPCPDAIAILLIAIAISRIMLGLVLIVVFSSGMAAVLIAIGMVMVHSRKAFGKTDFLTRAAPGLSVISAFIVLGLGAGLIYNALGNSRLFQDDSSEDKEVVVELPDARTRLRHRADNFLVGQSDVLYMGLDALEWRQIFRMPTAGGEALQLTAEDYGVWDFALSPDDQQIVYFAPYEGRGGNLMLIDVDGSKRRLLQECPDAPCSGAVWFPDGQRIVYSRVNPNPSDPTYNIPSLWWVDVNSGESGAIFQDSTLPGFDPTWSIDGQWLSYIAPPANDIQIYNLWDGRTLTLVNQLGKPVIWGPANDVLLLFDIYPQQGQYITQLLRYDIETEQLTDLIDDEGFEDRSAVWSPNGEWIAMIRTALTETGGLSGDHIWLVRPDGSEAMQLTTDDDMLLPGTPVWSPDSEYLLVQRYPVGEAKPQVLLITIETGESRVVVRPGYNPVWLP